MTKIDILLPYWGEFALLRKTVDSVFQQTSNNWRLVIIDDCYPSDEAMKYFATLRDSRVTYIRHKKNIGITENFNFALEKASAEYCVILGCDDILLPDYIDTALNRIKDADFYQPGVEIIDKNGATYLPVVDRVKRILQPRQEGFYMGEGLATSLCRGNWLYFPSIVWRTSTIKRYRFNPKYKIVEDVVVELDLIRDGGKLFFDKYVTFQYRRFPDSLSSKEKSIGGVRFKEERDVYNYYAQVFADMGWRKASRAARLRLISRIHELVR